MRKKKREMLGEQQTQGLRLRVAASVFHHDHIPLVHNWILEPSPPSLLTIEGARRWVGGSGRVVPDSNLCTLDLDPSPSLLSGGVE
jgi:hypothetical protein